MPHDVPLPLDMPPARAGMRMAGKRQCAVSGLTTFSAFRERTAIACARDRVSGLAGRRRRFVTKASFVLAGHATTPRHTSGLSVSPATAEDPVPGLHRPPVRRVKRARDDDLPPHQRIATT